MINIIKQEIPIDESLKKKLEFICNFCNTTFSAFNHGKDIFVENLQKHIKLSEFQEYIKSL